MQKSIYSKTNELFARLLRNARESKGLSLRQAAELIGRHHSIIGNVETQVRRMDVVEFIEYCERLELDPHEAIDYLLENKSKNTNFT